MEHFILLDGIECGSNVHLYEVQARSATIKAVSHGKEDFRY